MKSNLETKNSLTSSEWKSTKLMYDFNIFTLKSFIEAFLKIFYYF